MRFGIATTEITPPFPTAMHGYGARHDRFDEVNDPLTFTAVVLEASGRRALLGAADICTFANDGTTPELLKSIGEVVDCPPDNVILNASHTHGGPKMPSSSPVFENERYLDATRRYRDWLHERILETVEEAAQHLQEGTLWYGEGKTDFPMNRRLDRDGEVRNAPCLDGPIDDRLCTFALKDANEAMRAVGIRLSCHPVATGSQHRITADYVGAWRAAFSEAFGDTVAPFFLQGAGGDARPCHVADRDRWRQLPLEELPSLGRDLLAETLAVLTGSNLRPVEDLVLQGSINTVHLPCEAQFTKPEDFQPMLQSESEYLKRFAEEGLKRCEEGKTLDDRAAYQVQTLWLNREICLIGIDAEPLCGLGRVVEAAVEPAKGLLLGYVNGCVAYIPDTYELKRGGYEADAYLYELWTGPYKPGLEQVVADGVAPFMLQGNGT